METGTIAEQDGYILAEVKRLYPGKESDIGNFLMSRQTKGATREQLVREWHEALIEALRLVKKGQPLK